MFYYFSSFPIFCFVLFQHEYGSDQNRNSQHLLCEIKRNNDTHYEKISSRNETIECETENPEMELHCNYHVL